MELPSKDELVSEAIQRLEEKYVGIKKNLEEEKREILEEFSERLEEERRKLLEKLGYE